MYIFEAPLKIVQAFEQAVTKDSSAQKHVSIVGFDYPNTPNAMATAIFELKKLDSAQKRNFLDAVKKQYRRAKIR